MMSVFCVMMSGERFGPAMPANTAADFFIVWSDGNQRKAIHQIPVAETDAKTDQRS